MKTLKILFVCLCFSVCFVIFTGHALAEDFTFNIPIELHNIPSQLSHWRISIGVYDSVVDYDHELAIGNSYFDISNGEFVQTVTVKFNAFPAVQAIKGKASVYTVMLSCESMYVAPGSNASQAMKLDGPFPYDNTKPFVWRIQGNINGTPNNNGPRKINLQDRPLKDLFKIKKELSG